MSELDFDCVPYPRSKLFFSIKDEFSFIEMILDKISSLYEGVHEVKYQEAPASFGAAANNACKLLGEGKVGGRVIMFASESSPLGFGKKTPRPVAHNTTELMTTLQIIPNLLSGVSSIVHQLIFSYLRVRIST